MNRVRPIVGSRHRAMGKWVRISADLPTDDRIMRAGWRAELLFVRTIALSRLFKSDGHLTTDQQEIAARKYTPREARDAWDALLREGLLESCEDGVRIPFDKWSKYQDTEAELEDKREARREYERERKAEYRRRKREQDGEF